MKIKDLSIWVQLPHTQAKLCTAAHWGSVERAGLLTGSRGTLPSPSATLPCTTVSQCSHCQPWSRASLPLQTQRTVELWICLYDGDSHAGGFSDPWVGGAGALGSLCWTVAGRVRKGFGACCTERRGGQLRHKKKLRAIV